MAGSMRAADDLEAGLRAIGTRSVPTRAALPEEFALGDYAEVDYAVLLDR
jgi:hypothetical protein